MSHVVKVAVLSAVALLGLEIAVPKPAVAEPALVQSRMQQLMDRSRRRQARLEQDRLFAEEEARIEAEAEAARRAEAEAEAQATNVLRAADPADAEADESGDEAETPVP